MMICQSSRRSVGSGTKCTTQVVLPDLNAGARKQPEQGSPAGLRISRDIHGFKFSPASAEDGRPCWRVEGALADKVARWKEEERIEREAEEQRLRGSRWEDDSMEVDDEEDMHVDGESTEDEDDSEEIRKLKVSVLILRALTMTQRMLTIHLSCLGAPTVSADAP